MRFADMAWENKRVLVTGGNGFLGKWVCRQLLSSGILPENIIVPSSKEFDLRFRENCISVVSDADIVLHLAGRDGGIQYNMQHPGSIFYDNIMMNLQMMEAARVANVEKYVSVGSVCSYPRNTDIPFLEKNFWNGYPDHEYAAYCMAKKMSVIQSRAYKEQYDFSALNLLLTNMYGPGDTFDPRRSRVVASLIRKFVDAKNAGSPNVTMWGTGSASRELLYVEDAARAIILAAQYSDSPEPVNIGSGIEITIRELSEFIKTIVGYTGEIIWDSSKPEGDLRRCSDVSRAEREFGFKAETPLSDGLRKTVQWYLKMMSNNQMPNLYHED